MKLPKDTMLEILEGYLGKIIDDEIVDHRRWSIVHRLTFEYQDKFYQANYHVGATESQDERPWEYEEEVDCTEVRPVEKTVVVYVKV